MSEINIMYITCYFTDTSTKQHLPSYVLVGANHHLKNKKKSHILIIANLTTEILNETDINLLLLIYRTINSRWQSKLRNVIEYISHKRFSLHHHI